MGDDSEQIRKVGCDDFYYESMGLLGIYSVVGTIQALISVFAAYQLINIHRSQKMSMLLISSSFMFYICTFIFGIMRIARTIFYCWKPEYYFASWYILYYLYGLHLLALEAIFYARLKFLFDKTPFKISRNTAIAFWTQIALQLLIGLVLQTGWAFVILPVNVSFAIVAITVLLTLITTQALAWMFVYKLKRVHQERQDSLDLSQNAELMTTIRKYAILAVTSVMVTLFYILYNFVTSEWSDSTYMISSYGLVVVVDIFMDTLCMTLSLEPNHKWYLKCCRCCHWNCYGGNHMKSLELDVVSPASLSSDE